MILGPRLSGERFFLHVVIVFVTNEEKTKVKFNALVLLFFCKDPAIIFLFSQFLVEKGHVKEQTNELMFPWQN